MNPDHYKLELLNRIVKERKPDEPLRVCVDLDDCALVSLLCAIDELRSKPRAAAVALSIDLICMALLKVLPDIPHNRPALRKLLTAICADSDQNPIGLAQTRRRPRRQVSKKKGGKS